MIPFSEHDKQVLARIDADGSDGYDLNIDRIRATNAAQRQLVTTLGNNDSRKFTGEGLRDLRRELVFQTTHAGHIAIDDLLTLNNIGEKLWTVVGVHPQFESYGPQVIVGDPIPTNSLLRNDIRFTKPLKSAKRYTIEQRAQIEKDIFAPGNSVIPESDEKVEFGYLFGSRAVTAAGQVVGSTLEVFPHTFGQRRLVAVSYLKEPSAVPEMPAYANDALYASTQLEWPMSCAELLVALTYRILSIKVGDQTTAYMLSKEEENNLLRSIL